MSAYDVVAPSFDSYRALPPGVPEAIRVAVLNSTRAAPRVLDLGAGSGRIGAPFAAAGDNYVGVDLSSGMLRLQDAQPLRRLPPTTCSNATSWRTRTAA